MDISLERHSLIRALGHVYRIVERRNTVPILANVLIKAEAGVVQLRTTDLDIEVEEQATAEVQTAGSTTVNAQFLHDIVRKIPEGAMIHIKLDDEGENLLLKAGRASFRLQVLPDHDFPTLGETAFSHEFSIKAGVLKRLFEKTQFAISTEETRYYLNGVHWHQHEDSGRLRSVATDGHRLVMVAAELPEEANGMPPLIVPRKAVSEILKLIEDPEADIQIALSDARMRFVFGSTVLITKTIDGTFPDYEKVIPKNNDKYLRASTSTLTEAIDRVSVLSSERSRAVKLTLSEAQVEVSVSNPDSGTASEDIEVDYEGDALTIGVNARYMLDVTQAITSDTIELDLLDATGPILIRDPADKDAVFVLMPMRV